MSQDNVFVIEMCRNCSEHCWNTRHDEAKYQEFFKRVSQSILERVPNAIIMKNMIPKHYLDYDIYNNLISNDDDTIPHF